MHPNQNITYYTFVKIQNYASHIIIELFQIVKKKEYFVKV